MKHNQQAKHANARGSWGCSPKTIDTVRLNLGAFQDSTITISASYPIIMIQTNYSYSYIYIYKQLQPYHTFQWMPLQLVSYCVANYIAIVIQLYRYSHATIHVTNNQVRSYEYRQPNSFNHTLHMQLNSYLKKIVSQLIAEQSAAHLYDAEMRQSNLLHGCPTMQQNLPYMQLIILTQFLYQNRYYFTKTILKEQTESSLQLHQLQLASTMQHSNKMNSDNELQI